VTNEQLLMIFVACTGAAVLLQAFVLLAMLFTARKALKLAQEQIEELRTTLLPMVKDTKQLLTNVGPKIESVATDMAALTSGLRAQTAKIEISAGEILERVHRQTTRVDTILTNTLDTVDRAAAAVADVISVPLRQLSGFAAFARAALSSFRSAPPRDVNEPRPTHAAADKDLFV
jgi:ABC-type transporter Mla subunit MlaD